MSAGEKLRSAGGAAQQRLIERSPQEVRGEYLVKLKYSTFFQINLMWLFFFNLFDVFKFQKTVLNRFLVLSG